jgi:hypothetical protein
MNTHKPTPVLIQNISYHSAVEMHKYIPKHFKGCPRSRTIVENKKLQENDYIYAYIKDAVYIKSNKNYAKAKLFLTQKWVENNIPEMNQKNEEKIERFTYPEAPEILELDDNEKFKDEQGNVIEIEVRGERNQKNCYFKVTDISIAFNMPNILHTLIDKNTNYLENIHYKCFTVVKLKKNVLYLTYSGFRKVINISQKNFSSSMLFLLNKWLEQFDNSLVNEYVITQEDFDKEKEGYVYCVTSDLLNAIKIGFWRGSICSLKKRYTTSYGKNLTLHYVYTKYPCVLEKECHKYFNKQKITNELFEKEHIKKYIDYLDKNIKIE